VREAGLLEPRVRDDDVGQVRDAAAKRPEQDDVRVGGAREQAAHGHVAVDARLPVAGGGKRVEHVLRVQAGLVLVQEAAEHVHVVVGDAHGAGLFLLRRDDVEEVHDAQLRALGPRAAEGAPGDCDLF